jgi:large subunit ribosomal protein L25
MTQTNFTVQLRADQKPKFLRREGLVPANIFGGDESIAVQMPATEFSRLYEEVGETGLVYVQIEGGKKQYPVLVEEVQVDPVDDSLIHVSFKQVNLTKKIQATVPVETLGEFDVPEGVLVVVQNEIEVEALPTDFPEKFEVDVSVLTEIGQMITYKDLEYDREKVTLILGEEGEEEPVVLVQEQREEEEEEPEEEELLDEDGEPVAEGEEGEAAEGEEGEQSAKEDESDKGDNQEGKDQQED